MAIAIFAVLKEEKDGGAFRRSRGRSKWVLDRARDGAGVGEGRGGARLGALWRWVGVAVAIGVFFLRRLPAWNLENSELRALLL